MKKKLNLLTLGIALAALTISSCNKTEDFVQEPIPDHVGYYVLNAGSNGSSSLGFYRFNSNEYISNILSEENSGATLGMNATDLVPYGSKLYIAVNGSNKVLVLNNRTAEILEEIDVESPRYLMARRGKMYLTHGADQFTEIDTATYQKTRSVTIGSLPQKMAAVGDRIYVTNSGIAGSYDNRVSIVNQPNFTVDPNSIVVANNINAIVADSASNMLYVNADAIKTGDEITSPSKLYYVNTANREVKSYEWGGENLVLANTNQILLTSSNKVSGRHALQLVNGSNNTWTDFVTNNDIKQPSSLQLFGFVNSAEVWVMDKKDGTGNGEAFVYAGNAQLMLKFTTGVSPLKVSFRQ